MAEKNIPRKERFQQAYAGKAPWDIGKRSQLLTLDNYRRLR